MTYLPLSRDSLVKALGKGFDPRKFEDEHDKAQWAKLRALPNLVYTDDIGFSLWRNDEIVGAPVPLDGDVEVAGAKLGARPALVERFADRYAKAVTFGLLMAKSRKLA